MRSIHPGVADGLCYVVVKNRQGESLTEPTRDMGVIIEALGRANTETESLADEAFEYLTGHRCPTCQQAIMPRLICHQCGQCPSCCTRHGAS